MADPTRKLDKGHGRPRGGAGTVVQFPEDPMAFWVEPASGAPRFLLDLNEFATGRAVGAGLRWGGDFSGRPGLIRDLAPAIRLRHRTASPATAEMLLSGLRAFWRYLDADASTLPVQTLADVGDAHGARFVRWLTPSYGAMHMVASIIQQARADRDMPPLAWPPPPATPSPTKDSPDPKTVRSLYNVLKARAKGIKEDFAVRPDESGRHLDMDEVAVFLALFLVHTGWNLGTALNLDVTDGASWAVDHPLRPDVKVIHAVKDRSGTYQHALSLTRPEFHPYRIVEFLTEATKATRDALSAELAEAERDQARNPADHAIRARTEHLAAALRSPWLFATSRWPIRFGAFGRIEARNVVKVIRKALAAEAARSGTPLPDITAKALRDCWIGFAYANSGHQWLVAQLAAGHATTATLRRYLNKRRWRAHGEQQVSKLQNALWDEIRARRIVDGAILRWLVENGEITEEQRQRLADHRRSRTIVGTRCRDPHHPPRSVAPQHRDGDLCRIQRCILCPHAMIFDDSLDGLARRMAELRHIQGTTPLVRWVGSSFEEEMEAAEAALSLFDRGRVEAAVAEWQGKFVRGEEPLFDVDASYPETADA